MNSIKHQKRRHLEFGVLIVIWSNGGGVTPPAHTHFYNMLLKKIFKDNGSTFSFTSNVFSVAYRVQSFILEDKVCTERGAESAWKGGLSWHGKGGWIGIEKGDWVGTGRGLSQNGKGGWVGMERWSESAQRGGLSLMVTKYEIRNSETGYRQAQHNDGSQRFYNYNSTLPMNR